MKLKKTLKLKFYFSINIISISNFDERKIRCKESFDALDFSLKAV